MDKSKFPEPTMTFGNPDDPLKVQIRHPAEGLPLSITVDKTLCRIRYENETEDKVTIVIENSEA